LERDPPDAVLVLVDDLRGRLDRHPRLAGTARSGERQEPRLAVSQERDHLSELLLAAHERRRLNR